MPENFVSYAKLPGKSGALDVAPQKTGPQMGHGVVRCGDFSRGPGVHTRWWVVIWHFLQGLPLY